MNAHERSVVVPITIGSMFEWFEVFLYIYWAPLMSEAFFDLSIPLAELIHAILILGSGFIARPLGGIVFGYIGDRWGRRISFLISIVCITVPSIAIALMPSFSTWAYASLVYIGLMRFFQGIPAGGELPGALCLLAESASPERRRYLCSYLFVGPQIGQILSMLLCYLLQRNLTTEELISWGWRLSFFIGGLIGIIGFFARKVLHESDAFTHLKTDHKIEHHPLRESLQHQKRNITIAFFLSLFEVVGFFMIYFYLLENPGKTLSIEPANSLIVNLVLLSTLTISMPIFGSIPLRFRSQNLLKLSAVAIIFFSAPLYYFISISSEFWIFFFLTFLIILFVIQFSVLPSFISDLFPTRVRFTCIGLSFNIADGVIGGIIPFVGAWLMAATGNPASFVYFFPLTAAAYLFAIQLIRNKKEYGAENN